MDDKRRRRISGRVGAAIERERMRAGLTQETLAEKLGVGPQAVSRIERGVVHAPVWRLVEVSEVVGCTLAQLVGDASDAPIDQLHSLADVLDGLTSDDRAYVVNQAIQAATHLRRRGAGTKRRG